MYWAFSVSKFTDSFNPYDNATLTKDKDESLPLSLSFFHHHSPSI